MEARQTSAGSVEPSRSLLRSVVRATLWTLLGSTILTASLIVYILSHPDRIKTAVEHLLTTLTDRPFSIQGDFDISLGEEIFIRATQLTWANPDWSSSANMMEIGHFECTINLASLLDGPVLISDAKAENALLEFEWNEDDVLNWDFFADEPDDGDDAPVEAIPILLDKAQLTNVQLVFKDSVFTEPLTWKIQHAAQKQDEQNRLVISGKTLMDGLPLALQGRIGPFPELIVGGDVNAAARIKGPNQSLEFTAETSQLQELEDLNFDLQWLAPDVTIVLDMLNLPTEATDGQMSLHARLHTENGLLSGNIDGDIGEFKIDGFLKAPENHLLTDFHAELTSTGPSARGIGRLFEVSGLPAKPYELRFKADTIDKGIKLSELYFSSAGAELSAEGTLPRAPTLVDADLKLKIKGQNLAEYQGLTKEVTFFAAPFSANFNLKGNGKGVRDSLSGELSLGKMTGSLTASLAERPDYLGSEFDYALVFPNAQKILGMFDLQVTTNEPLKASGKAAVEANGLSIAGLDIQIENHHLILDGLIANETSGLPTSFKTKANGPSFNQVMLYFLPFELGPSLPYSLTGSIEIKDGISRGNGTGKVGTTTLKQETYVDIRDSADLDMRMQLEASGPNFDEWLQDLIREERINDKFKVAANLRLNEEQLVIDKIDLNIRNARLRGSVVEILNDGTDSFKFDLQANGQNLADELPKISIYEPAAVAFELRAKGELEPNNVIIDYLKGTIGSAELDISGGMGLQPEMEAESLKIYIKGNNIAELGRFEGWEVRDAPFSVQAEIDSEGDRIETQNMLVVVGDSDLRGDFRADFSAKPYVDMRFTSRNITAGSVLNREQVELLDALISSDDDSAPSEMVIPYTVIPVELLNDFNGQLKLSVDTMRRKEEKLSNFLLDVSLDNGLLDVSKLTADTTFGNITSNLRYTPSANNYDLEFSVTARNVRLPGTKEQEADPDQFVGYNIDSYLTGSGKNSTDITATLDGFAWLRGGKRKIQNMKYSSLFGDAFTEIGIMINPFYKKDPYTNIECEAFLFEIEDGIMETSPVAFIKTDKLNVASIGTIDLNTEQLKLGIETDPRKGIGLSASDLFTPFVRIGGTMAEPKPEVDPKGSLIQGSAAVYTAGLSIVAKSLYQRWIKADKSCADYVALARSARLARDPAHVPAD